MFDDGIYGLTIGGGINVADAQRSPVNAADEHCDVEVEAGPVEALAILRDGKILGSDRCGGLFSGTCEFDPVAGLISIKIRVDVPPDAQLITGFAGGPTGATIHISAAVEAATKTASTTVDVAGQPVDVAFAFLGPLPG